MITMEMKSKLIVALDVSTVNAAQRLVDELRGVAGMFKIGSQLFTATGPGFVRDIVNSGERVFLDLKFHDIPNTVAAAGVEAARLGVSIFNVHAAGGSEMMRQTAEAVAECAHAKRLTKPAIIAVTVLTSADELTLAEVGWSSNAEALVRQLSMLAAAAGLDGVVASPREVGIVRSAVTTREFIVVTPGVRPEGAARGDQSRVTTPAEAIAAGADYLVIGRPIIAAPDPAKAALQIIEEMESSSINSIP
jgi:orotidine-5'-phosphate decarboxylase